MQGMADLYGVNIDVLEPLIASNVAFLSSFDDNNLHYTLTDYVRGFLQDPGRSQLYYCDPRHHHVFICHCLFSRLESNFESWWVSN